MKKVFFFTVCLLLVSSGALADWSPGDPYKMHYPQLPDPKGWDVAIAREPEIGFVADNWRCTESGPVSDIHIWGSFRHDVIQNENLGFRITIYDHDSRNNVPGNPLWAWGFGPADYTFREDPEGGSQGWLDISLDTFERNDHLRFFQYNFEEIPGPFFQEEGQMYWLGIWTTIPDFFGWKTSLDNFGPSAVYTLDGTHYFPLRDDTGLPLDMAFVITPIPGAVWLLGSGLLGLLGFRRKFRKK